MPAGTVRRIKALCDDAFLVVARDLAEQGFAMRRDVLGELYPGADGKIAMQPFPAFTASRRTTDSRDGRG